MSSSISWNSIKSETTMSTSLYKKKEEPSPMTPTSHKYSNILDPKMV